MEIRFILSLFSSQSSSDNSLVTGQQLWYTKGVNEASPSQGPFMAPTQGETMLGPDWLVGSMFLVPVSAASRPSGHRAFRCSCQEGLGLPLARGGQIPVGEHRLRSAAGTRRGGVQSAVCTLVCSLYSGIESTYLASQGFGCVWRDT